MMKFNYPVRIARARNLLANSSIDALLISNVQNCRYLSGFENTDPNVAFLLITQEKLTLVTDYRYSQQAQKECPYFEIIERNRATTSLASQFKKLLDSSVKQLAFEQDFVSHSFWQNLSQELNSIQLVGVSNWIEPLRMIKDEQEITCIKQAAKIADHALADLVNFMKPNMTERDASLELEFQMQKRGSEGLSFPTILISGAKTSLPHGMPSDKKLTHGDLITIDFGAVVQGYRSDMTRAFVVGEPNQKQQNVYALVEQAQRVGMQAVSAGIAGSEPYYHAKAVLDASEFAEFQGEGLGHGVGLYLHEQPFLQPSCEITLKENMVITIEPGIYIPNWGGVRIEDDLRVTAQGYEVLTHSPRELIIID